MLIDKHSKWRNYSFEGPVHISLNLSTSTIMCCLSYDAILKRLVKWSLLYAILKWVGLFHIIYGSSYKMPIFPLAFVVVNRGKYCAWHQYYGHQSISFIAYTNGTKLSISCFFRTKFRNRSMLYGETLIGLLNIAIGF